MRRKLPTGSSDLAGGAGEIVATVLAGETVEVGVTTIIDEPGESELTEGVVVPR